MKQPLVSIIMPVYNAALYLERSVASIQNQTYVSWELLIVDDGSEDNSRDIINTYTATDSRIKLICNQHGGTARARNTALSIATGDYFSFIDADDVYHPFYIENMLSIALKQTSDVVICDFLKGTDCDEFTKMPIENDYFIINKNAAFASMYGGEWPLLISPWNKLYKKALFDDIRFPDGRFFEDAATINLLIYKADVICVTKSPLYFYYIAPNSSSKTKRSRELLDREWALRSHWEFFFEHNRPDLALLALPFYLVELIGIHDRIEHSDKPDDKKLIRERFETVYKQYKRKIKLTDLQKKHILAFRHPVIYDIKNMIREQGIYNTIIGFAKRKLR